MKLILAKMNLENPGQNGMSTTTLLDSISKITIRLEYRIFHEYVIYT